MTYVIIVYTISILYHGDIQSSILTSESSDLNDEMMCVNCAILHGHLLNIYLIHVWLYGYSNIMEQLIGSLTEE